MPERAAGRTRLTLRVVERACDFARGSRRVLFNSFACCCCCCLWCLGGVAGTVWGGLSAASASEREHGPRPAPLTKALWIGMLFGLGAFLLTFCLLGNVAQPGLLLLVAMPAGLPFVALGGWLYARSKVPDQLAGRIAGRAMGGLFLGGLTGSLGGFALVALLFEPMYALAAAAGAVLSGAATKEVCSAHAAPRELAVPARTLQAPAPAPDPTGVAFLATETPPAAAVACPICGDPLGEGALTACDRCETPHHQDCWDYFGGCAVFGCSPGGHQGRLPEPERLAPLLESWSFWSRLRWWSYLAGALSVALAPMAYCLDVSQDAPALLVLGGFAGLAVFGATSWPDLDARARLTEALRAPVEPADRVVTAVLTRLERSRSEPLLLKVAELAPWAYGLLALLSLPALVLDREPPDAVAFAGLLLALLAGWAVTFHAASRARRRRVIAQTLTSRLYAAELVTARRGRRG